MPPGEKKTTCSRNAYTPPKFIVANNKEVKLDEMFKSIQWVKGLSVVTALDTNKLNCD